MKIWPLKISKKYPSPKTEPFNLCRIQPDVLWFYGAAGRRGRTFRRERYRCCCRLIHNNTVLIANVCGYLITNTNTPLTLQQLEGNALIDLWRLVVFFVRNINLSHIWSHLVTLVTYGPIGHIGQIGQIWSHWSHLVTSGT